LGLGIYMSALLWHFELAVVLDLGWMDVWSWRFFGILLPPSVVEYSRNNMSWFLVDPIVELTRFSKLCLKPVF